MRIGPALLTLGLLLASVPASFGAEVPRQSPEFVIHHPGGKQSLLSSHKGKVVVLQFIFTTCPHCQTTSQLLSKLYTEYGPHGFQPLGVAVNPMALMLVDDFVKSFRVNFPVGASETGPALSYLQIGGADRWVVPQIAVIDKKGVIRFQTPPSGDERLSNEQFLRTEIEKLLKEGTTAPAKARPAAKKKST
jgi:thiol-disulfide isomerase/thioredoxin